MHQTGVTYQGGQQTGQTRKLEKRSSLVSVPVNSPCQGSPAAQDPWLSLSSLGLRGVDGITFAQKTLWY